MKRTASLEEFILFSPARFCPLGQLGKPTHKTAHLQIAQATARPKFAKELFFANPPGDSAKNTHKNKPQKK